MVFHPFQLVKNGCERVLHWVITFMQITDRHTGAVATFQSTAAQTERNEVVK